MKCQAINNETCIRKCPFTISLNISGNYSETTLNKTIIRGVFAINASLSSNCINQPFDNKVNAIRKQMNRNSGNALSPYFSIYQAFAVKL